MTAPAPVLRIANCSGFYGDRISAAREMVEGGPIDFLTGDYLAELTLLILWKNQRRHPATVAFQPSLGVPPPAEVATDSQWICWRDRASRNGFHGLLAG